MENHCSGPRFTVNYPLVTEMVVLWARSLTPLAAPLPRPPPLVCSALWRSAEPRPAACPSWCRKRPRAGLETERGHKQETRSGKRRAAETERNNPGACRLSGQEGNHPFMVGANERLRESGHRQRYRTGGIYTQTIGNKMVNRAFLDCHRQRRPQGCYSGALAPLSFL